MISMSFLLSSYFISAALDTSKLTCFFIFIGDNCFSFETLAFNFFFSFFSFAFLCSFDLSFFLLLLVFSFYYFSSLLISTSAIVESLPFCIVELSNVVLCSSLLLTLAASSCKLSCLIF